MIDLNLANKLTMFRVVLVPFFIVAVSIPQIPMRFLWALVIFVIASITDMLDGKIARKNNMVTNFGKFLDPLADKILERGGKGVISVLSNVCPQETHDIVAKYLSGDIEGSRALMNKYMKLAKNLFCDVNPIPVKEAVNFIGFNAGHCRLPLIDTTEENKLLIKETLKEYGIIK